MTRKLDIAFWDYDRTAALADGTVRIEGVDATYHGGRIVIDVFEAMVRSAQTGSLEQIVNLASVLFSSIANRGAVSRAAAGWVRLGF